MFKWRQSAQVYYCILDGCSCQNGNLFTQAIVIGMSSELLHNRCQVKLVFDKAGEEVNMDVTRRDVAMSLIRVLAIYVFSALLLISTKRYLINDDTPLRFLEFASPAFAILFLAVVFMVYAYSKHLISSYSRSVLFCSSFGIFSNGFLYGLSRGSGLLDQSTGSFPLPLVFLPLVIGLASVGLFVFVEYMSRSFCGIVAGSRTGMTTRER